MVIRKYFLALLGCLLCGGALAEGFYVGAGFGITQIEDEEDGISFEDNPLGWRILIGYEFSENFAVEGAYLDSGEAEDTVEGIDVDAELTAFTVSGLGIFPIGESAKLFGKLGYYDGEQEVTAFGVTVDDDDSGITAGAGIRFDYDQFSIRAEYDWFDTDIDTLWSIGLGFQYMFAN